MPRQRWLTPLRKVLVIFAAAAVALTVVAAPHVEEAAAVSASDFNAGNIISDSLFYDGTAMTSTQINSFLKQQVPRCTIGDSGRVAGSEYGNTQIAQTCLLGHRSTTKTKPANAYCKSYTGASRETAAKIISKVGRACGISQKVLLIMLEKEQSLVTDTWPTSRQFNVAMGYGCPDTGPNWSANCDPGYYGFFNQVYHAAWQLKVYKANPSNYNYKAFQANRIQWHPNTGCGTSTVNIANYATAALYIYTPYRPNAAALNAGWGTGDDCSSYGNRNFFLFYKSWFGSTQVHAVNGEIKSFVDAHGGVKAFGNAIAARVSHSGNNGGVSQRFEKGLIAYSNQLKKAVFVPNGRILTAYLKAKGPDGSWGWPYAAQTYPAQEKTKYQRFKSGMAVANAARAVKFVPNQTLNVWNAEGAALGWLGYPLDTGTVLSSTTAYQRFENGTVIRGSVTKLALTRAEAARWRNAGGQPKLGLPTSHQVAVPGEGWHQRTQKGRLFTLKSTGASVFVDKGTLLDFYMEKGGPAKHSWPKTPLNCSLPEACKLPLQETDVLSGPHGTFFMDKAQSKFWKSQPDRLTKLGYPDSNSHQLEAGSLQRYKNGFVSIPKATNSGVRLDSGPIFDAYQKSGWYKSPWGLLLQVGTNGQSATFSNGTASINNGSVVFTYSSKKTQSTPNATDTESQGVLPDDTSHESGTDDGPTPDDLMNPESPEPDSNVQIPGDDELVEGDLGTELEAENSASERGESDSGGLLPAP